MAPRPPGATAEEAPPREGHPTIAPARFARILVGVDASPLANDAVDWAIALSRAHRAHVTVVHVVASHAAALAAGAPYGGIPAPELLEGLEEAGRAALQDASDRLRRANVPHATRLSFGGPAAILTEAAHEAEADLVILGARNRTLAGFPRLGSVARGVLHHADANVLLVRGPPLLRRILAATDGSEESLVACATALQLAREHDAHTTLLHVVDPTQRPPHTDTPEARAGELPDLAGLFTAPTPGVHYEAKIGDPVDHIVDAAEAHDLVTMGTRGQSGLRSLVLGSVSDDVARLTHANVLVLRRPKDTRP